MINLEIGKNKNEIIVLDETPLLLKSPIEKIENLLMQNRKRQVTDLRKP
jgi:hypothetical protein